VDVDVPGPVGPAPGSCVGPSIGVMGLMGGRDGDGGGDVRDEADARRGFAMGRGAVVAGAGWASVAMVRPGMVASVIWCRFWRWLLTISWPTGLLGACALRVACAGRSSLESLRA
jgi:hypothetical protein